MNIGDIVNFYSSFEPWQHEYKGRCPGIVLTVKSSSGRIPLKSYDVLWKDGSVTTEKESYLYTLADQL